MHRNLKLDNILIKYLNKINYMGILNNDFSVNSNSKIGTDYYKEQEIETENKCY